MKGWKQGNTGRNQEVKELSTRERCLGKGAQEGGDGADSLAELRVGVGLCFDLAVGVKNGPMVASSKALSDLREAGWGQLAAKVHGDLAGVGNRLGAARAEKIGVGDRRGTGRRRAGFLEWSRCCGLLLPAGRGEGGVPHRG